VLQWGGVVRSESREQVLAEWLIAAFVSPLSYARNLGTCQSVEWSCVLLFIWCWWSEKVKAPARCLQRFNVPCHEPFVLHPWAAN
jgi:hypothetical protein